MSWTGAAPPELHLGVADNGHVLIEVRDHGPGVPPEQLARLTEAFYRPDDARQRSTGGVGLGLYLARELCLNNGAKLDYEYRYDPAASGARKASGRFVITFAQPAAAGVHGQS